MTDDDLLQRLRLADPAADGTALYGVTRARSSRACWPNPAALRDAPGWACAPAPHCSLYVFKDCGDSRCEAALPATRRKSVSRVRCGFS
jgi:hypothetical protein